MAKPTAVITGSSTGFGRLTAETFVREGWNTYATLRDPSGKNAKHASELGAAGAHVVALDVTDDASVDAAAKQILAEAGTVDVLVNNAGNAYFGVTEAFTVAQAERQFATNFFGAVRVTRAFLPALRERKNGLIVYVSSVVGRSSIPFGGFYSASKWALESYAESLSYELRAFDIDVALVEPGAYPTPIGESRTEPEDTARAAAYAEAPAIMGAVFTALSQSAAGHDPQEVASAILELAKMNPGARPLRTIVGDDYGVRKINALVEPIQTEMIRAFGAPGILPKDHVTA